MGRLTALGQEFTRIRLLRQDDPIEEFTCGSSAIDAWLHLHARRAMKESTARVYVLSNLEGSLCGFYSLSTFSVARTGDLPGSFRRNTPDPIPCTLLGQLGVDERFQGRTAGGRLLQDAIRRSMEASKVVASKALVVDALNEDAYAFYEHFGFRSLDGSFRLFLKL